MQSNGEARFIYALAVRLKKFPSEIIDRPIEELRALHAFLEWDAQAHARR
jgi:hypothetical protein